MLCAHDKGVRRLKETQVDEKVRSNADRPAAFMGMTALRTAGSETRYTGGAAPYNRARSSKRKGARGGEKPREGRTDLHHGLLVLAVFHLRCGQVNDATLHWVFVTVIDEDIRATDHNKMFSPVAGKRLLELQVAFLRNH